MNTEDHIAISMMAMAETLRNLTPPKCKMSIKCIRGALTLTLSPQMHATLQLQLGKLMLYYTENVEEARNILLNTYQIFHGLSYHTNLTEFNTPRLEALVLLCESTISGPLSAANLNTAISLVTEEIRGGKTDKHFDVSVKLFLFYVEASFLVGNATSAFEGCDSAIKIFENKDCFTHLYFRMTKIMLSVRTNSSGADDEEVRNVGLMVNSLDQSSPVTANLKAFYCCILLSSMLSDGKVRSARQHLRSMQNIVQNLPRDENDFPCSVKFLATVPLTAFACLMTVATDILQCRNDRALKYFNVGMKHLREYFVLAYRSPRQFGIMKSVQRMRLMFDELIAQVHIVSCKPSSTLTQILDMVRFSSKFCPELLEEFGPSMHNLLALHCIYLQEYDHAVKHYQSALTYKCSQERNLWITTNMNLAILYLSRGDQSGYYGVADRLIASQVNQCPTIIKNNVSFIHAFHNYLLNKPLECKKMSAECMEAAKKEDLFRLHGMAVLLLSLVYPSNVNEFRDFINAVEPTLDWAAKIGDHSLSQWSNKVVARIRTKIGQDPTQNIAQAQSAKSHIERDVLMADHMKHEAAPLIEWFEGDPLDFLPKDD